MDKVTSFAGEYNFLSNFYPVEFVYCGRTWPTAEHAYQAVKARRSEYYEKIANATTPGIAKRLGQQVPTAPEWNEQRVRVMSDILLKKFDVDELKAKLLATGNLVLEEGNMWGDEFWGVNLRTGKGKNMLGKLLMQVREIKRYME